MATPLAWRGLAADEVLRWNYVVQIKAERLLE
jgi:hypothetical protein